MGHLSSEMTELDRLRAERDQLELRVKQLEFDAMTGLLRREVGIERILRTRRRQRCSVVLVDVDDLKRHNAVGLDQGDWAVEMAARATLSACRGGDVAVRWGGDEMLLCLVGDAGQAAIQVAERVDKAVRLASRARVSVSCGYAVVDGIGIKDLHRAATSAHTMAAETKRQRREAGGAAVHVQPASFAIPAPSAEARRILSGRPTEADENFILSRLGPLLSEATAICEGAGDLVRAPALCAELAALVRVKVGQVEAAR